MFQIWEVLLMNKFRGRDFETHWKNFHVIKKLLEDRLRGGKLHLRQLLIDRIMLHQEFRIESRNFTFTETHKQIIENLYRLSVSHYSEVSPKIQFFKTILNLFRIPGSSSCTKKIIFCNLNVPVLLHGLNPIIKTKPPSQHERKT